MSNIWDRFQRALSILFTDSASVEPSNYALKKMQGFNDQMAGWGQHLESRLKNATGLSKTTYRDLDLFEINQKRFYESCPGWPQGVSYGGRPKFVCPEDLDLETVEGVTSLPGYKQLKAATDQAGLKLRVNMHFFPGIPSPLCSVSESYNMEFTISTPDGKSFKDHFDQLKMERSSHNPPQDGFHL